MQTSTLEYCCSALGEKYLQALPLQGGDINNVYRLYSQSNNSFVVKINSATRFPQLLTCEAQGLRALALSSTIQVPEVLAEGVYQDEAFLVLEYIEPQRADKNFWVNFGRALAALHQNSHVFFGWDNSNYIGSLPQYNSPCSSWAAFYITQRIQPQIELAEKNNLLDKYSIKDLYRLLQGLPELLPEEPPSLIHGDLWQGNFICNRQMRPVLIDPSVAYASREVDLAMSRLFGGFSPIFYQAYMEAYPLVEGWEKRIEIYQLYYLLVHLNLFGGSYLSGIKRILSKF